MIAAMESKTKIKFLHTADIHLGRPLNPGVSQPPAELTEIFQQAGFLALERMVDLALQQEVDFVLVAGDLHDRQARSVRASRFLRQQCRRLGEAGIPLYAISGNHDPGADEKEPFRLPENVHIFSSEEVEVKEYRAAPTPVRILGQSYRTRAESRKMYTYYTVPEAARGFNIGLLHTGLDPDSRRYVPVSREDLEGKDDIDYWALGHVHRPAVVNPAAPALVYPGTPQPRTVQAGDGAGGCFLVEVNPAEPAAPPELEFVPTSPVSFNRIKLDVNSSGDSETIGNFSDLEELLAGRAEEILAENPLENLDFYGLDHDNVRISAPPSPESPDDPVPGGLKGHIARWHIRGRGAIHEMVSADREEAARELARTLNHRFAGGTGGGRRPFLWTHSLMLHTAPPLPDEEELKNNELYQEIMEVLEEIESGEELKNELLQAWGQVWQGDPRPEERRPDRFYPGEETVGEMLEAAWQEIIAELFAE